MCVIFSDFRHIMFYYGVGMGIGVLASVLIVFIIISRFIPGKVSGEPETQKSKCRFRIIVCKLKSLISRTQPSLICKHRLVKQ